MAHGAKRTLVVVILLQGIALRSGLSAQGLGFPPVGPPLPAADIFSAEPANWEGAATILLPVGARAVSMSRAVSAFRGPESAFWNPAGLARISEGRLMVLRGTPFGGDVTAFSVLLAKQPLGVIGFSYQLLDWGDQNLTDTDQNFLGTFTARDHVGIVSFSTRVLSRLDAGVNFKVFSTRYTCRGQCPSSGISGTTYLLDLGLMGEPIAQFPLRLAAMVAHLGPDLQIINAEQADPVPTRIRVAAAYEVLRHFTETPGIKLWLSAEAEDRAHDLGEAILYLGSEFVAGVEDQVFIRTGYGQSHTGQPAGASVGLGLRYQQFEMDIAKSLASASLTGELEPVYITFGVLF